MPSFIFIQEFAPFFIFLIANFWSESSFYLFFTAIRLDRFSIDYYSLPRPQFSHSTIRLFLSIFLLRCYADSKFLWTDRPISNDFSDCLSTSLVTSPPILILPAGPFPHFISIGFPSFPDYLHIACLFSVQFRLSRLYAFIRSASAQQRILSSGLTVWQSSLIIVLAIVSDDYLWILWYLCC